MLLIWGAEDRPCPVEMAYQLREALPGLKMLHVVPGAGHHVQADQPELFNDVVGRFLS